MTTKNIDLLCVSGVVVLLCSSYLWVLQPQWRRLKSLQAQERLLAQQVELHPQIQEGFAQLHTAVTVTEQRLIAFDQQLPHEVQLETFLRQLDQIAQRTSFTMTQIQPGQIQTAELYSTLALTITAEAAFPAFYDFLVALSEGPRLTNIDALTITRKPDSPLCDITFTLSIYMAKTPPAS
jgi:Tfp pilus assembly protein PilO